MVDWTVIRPAGSDSVLTVPFIWLSPLSDHVVNALDILLVRRFLARYRYFVFRCDQSDAIELATWTEKLREFRQRIQDADLQVLYVAANSDVEYFLTHVLGAKTREVLPNGAVLPAVIEKLEAQRAKV